MMSRGGVRTIAPSIARTHSPGTFDSTWSERPESTSSASTSVCSPSPMTTARGAAIEVSVRMIGRVGARHDHLDAAAVRRRHHGLGGFAHAQQAHLAQVVEVVFVDDREERPVTLERVVPLGFARRQHRVEERHVVAAIADGGRGIERAERRVRLFGRRQLGIELQEVRLAEQNVAAHGVDDRYAVATRARAGASPSAARR